MCVCVYVFQGVSFPLKIMEKTRKIANFHLYIFLYVIDLFSIRKSTICPRSLDPFNIVSYYVKWAKTSWTYSVHFILFYQGHFYSCPFVRTTTRDCRVKSLAIVVVFTICPLQYEMKKCCEAILKTKRTDTMQMHLRFVFDF